MTPEQLDEAIQFLLEQQAALEAALHLDREAARATVKPRRKTGRGLRLDSARLFSLCKQRDNRSRRKAKTSKPKASRSRH